MEWNNLAYNSTLSIGQELLIYPNEGFTTKNMENDDEHYIYHEVRKGDTLYSIAKQYKIPVKSLLEWNRKKSEYIQIGEKLIIQKDGIR